MRLKDVVCGVGGFVAQKQMCFNSVFEEKIIGHLESEEGKTVPSTKVAKQGMVRRVEGD